MRGNVRFRLDAKFLAQRVHGLHVGARDVFVHAYGGGAREIVIERDVQMAAVDAFANHPANAGFERFKALGHAQMQIEKAVIHAADGNAQTPAAFDGVRLRVARHRAQGGALPRRRDDWFGSGFGHRHTHSGPATREAGSASRNCIS